MAEHIRETAQLQPDGRVCIPNKILKALGAVDQKAFLECETYSKDKILITILSKWTPPKKGTSPEREKPK
jgi:hypothetical protein